MKITFVSSLLLGIVLVGTSHAFVPPVPVTLSSTRTAYSTTTAPPRPYARFPLSSRHMIAESVSVVVESAATIVADAAATQTAPPELGGISYSKASYYTILGLYALSFPGLWSTVARSTKAKIKRKTYVSAGEKADGTQGLGLRQQAGEIMACTFWVMMCMCVYVCVCGTTVVCVYTRVRVCGDETFGDSRLTLAFWLVSCTHTYRHESQQLRSRGCR
jgi:hypothetical protein